MTTNTKEKLHISDLNLQIQNDTILHSVNLTINEGEFLSLLGPSGCGKSTLLKAIAGILPIKSGSIMIGSKEISALPTHKRGAVVVFQDMRLFPNLTVEENVAFPLKMQGIGKTERLQTANELLNDVQMAGLGHRRISEISGGQQQRVALARALAAKPQILLLDEPFSALDENLREEMRSLVKKLHQQFGMTTILVTHDRAEALAMSDRVAIMFDGRIVQIGQPQEVYAHPINRRTADYFGNCAYISGTVHNKIFSANGISCNTDAPDGKYLMMLRYDALHTEVPGSYTITVKEIQFEGSQTIVHFVAEDGTLWKQSLPTTPPYQKGQTINCSLNTDQHILFPQE